MNKTIAATAAALCLFASAGCHSSAAEDTAAEAGAGSAAANRRAVHATLRWERLYDGKHMARWNYAVLEEGCKASGRLVRGLAPGEVQKLDTGAVELWRDDRGAYGRQRTWRHVLEERTDGGCVIRLEEQVQEESQSFREIDGTPIEISPVDPSDVALAAKLLGFTRVGESQVKGQPCTRWRSKNHEECVWSGGLDIGMDDGPVDSLCAGELGPMAYLKGLPLESKHGPRGPGCNLELETMTVGKGQLPEVGLAMAKLNTPATED